MSATYQEEISTARINLMLSQHIYGAQKKVELPVKLLTVDDSSHVRGECDLSGQKKAGIIKNNVRNLL